jgi:hypothetical protein
MKTLLGYVGNIEFSITRPDVISICKSGDNENDVKEVLKKPYIKKQFSSLSHEDIKNALNEISDFEDIDNQELNKIRLVWVCAWNIYDGKNF